MKKTGWKILFTMICLATAGGMMSGIRNAEASETDEMMSEAAGEEQAGPTIEWEMEEANRYGGISYYRQDNCGLSVTVSDAVSELVSAELKIGDSDFSLDDFDKEGPNTYVFALSEKEMSELILEDGEVTASVYAKDADERSEEAALTFVLDRTSPEFTLSLEDPSGDETVDGEVAYYGSSHTQLRAVYTIREEHFDPMLIGAEKVYTDTSDQTQSAVREKQIAGGTGYTDAHTYIMETDAVKEGCYRFGISGMDLAGNPLVMSEEEAQKEGYRKSICLEDGRYWTMEKVLDLTKPSLSLAVSDAWEQIFYQVEARDEDVQVLKYEPFQQKDQAKVMICAVDTSPCMISDRIRSAASGIISESTEEVFLENPVVTETVIGQQRFWIDQLTVRDRAGNAIRLGRSNTLFLDREGPKAEIDAPEPVAVSAEEITHRHADGRGLYNDDVTLQVNVEDAGGELTGSGLQTVYCKVFVNGEETDALTDCLNDAPDSVRPTQVVYGDDAALADCKTEYTGTVTIPKGGIFETNDIEVLVYAKDCAGNGTEEALARLRLGIDSTGPKARVIFDNNAAEHAFYFKDPRKADVQIYDRNMDADLITIDTQKTEQSGFSYEKGTDGTGNDDCYRKTIRYDQDGTYTLTISGTDALGNAFENEVMLEGIAPDRFVIDQTAPEIVVENVEDGNAYNGSVAPLIRFSDKNFSKDQTEVSLTGAREGNRIDLLPTFLEEAEGGSYAIPDIPVQKENDDIYTIKAKLRDLAGNESLTELEFSVNRYGSTYDYNNDRTTRDLVETYYSGQEKRVYLREINLNRLTDQKVTLYHDGGNRILQRGTDYRLRQESYGESRQYIYEFYGHNFIKEGNYEVVVQSVDAAGNINSNHSMRQNDGMESVRVKFAVDKTAPQILLNGTDAAKAPLFSEGEEIQILPDDNMQLQEVELSLQSDDDRKPIQLETWTGERLFQKLIQNRESLVFAFDAENKDRNLKIRAVDAAGNVSVGSASCMTEPEVQKDAVFVPATQEAQQAQKTERWFGIPVAVAGVALLLLLGQKKRRN